MDVDGLEDIIGPALRAEALECFPELGDEARVPNFMILVLRKSRAGGGAACLVGCSSTSSARRRRHKRNHPGSGAVAARCGIKGRCTPFLALSLPRL